MEIKMSASPGFYGWIQSPNYPDFVNGIADCSWTIKIPYGNIQIIT